MGWACLACRTSNSSPTLSRAAESQRSDLWLKIGAATLCLWSGTVNLTVLLSGEQSPLHVKDTTAGVGGQVGVLLERHKGTRFGVTYYSPIELNFSDDPSLSGLGPGNEAIFGSLRNAGWTSASRCRSA